MVEHSADHASARFVAGDPRSALGISSVQNMVQYDSVERLKGVTRTAVRCINLGLGDR
jgi:hypothetical protein